MTDDAWCFCCGWLQLKLFLLLALWLCPILLLLSSSFPDFSAIFRSGKWIWWHPMANNAQAGSFRMNNQEHNSPAACIRSLEQHPTARLQNTMLKISPGLAAAGKSVMRLAHLPLQGCCLCLRSHLGGAFSETHDAQHPKHCWTRVYICHGYTAAPVLPAKHSCSG